MSRVLGLKNASKFERFLKTEIFNFEKFPKIYLEINSAHPFLD